MSVHGTLQTLRSGQCPLCAKSGCASQDSFRPKADPWACSGTRMITRTPSVVSSIYRDKLKSNYACHNQSNAKYPCRRRRFTQRCYTKDSGTRGTDTGPDRVPRSYGKCAKRQREKKDARQPGGSRKQRGYQECEACGPLHTEGESDLEKAGGGQYHPCHVGQSIRWSPGVTAGLLVRGWTRMEDSMRDMLADGRLKPYWRQRESSGTKFPID